MKKDLSNIKKAKYLLDKNHCVAIPTETVYGLAANAYSDTAILKIFKLKKRPKSNPLIVHYCKAEDIKNDCELNSSFIKLYNKFCPGPLTFILKLKKNSKISKYVTNGKKTLAVRFPKNLKTEKLLKSLNYPLAAPSANISSKVSAVSSTEVKEDFGKKIKFVLDGGSAKIGLESTVINLYGKTQILRPGLITKNQISQVLNKKIKIQKKTDKIISPGLLKRHYSPGIPVKLNCKTKEDKAAFIVFGKKYKNNNKDIFNLSKSGDLEEAARKLYKTFRKIKNLGFKTINVVKIPNKKIGIAINDRLRKAAN